MALILLRHLRPHVAPGICYGRTDLGAPIAPLPALPPFDSVATSPLRRCRLLAEALHPAPLVDPRLAEMDFGAWEGLAWDAVPRAGLDAWAADFLHARPHGGESVAMLRARIRDAMAEHRAAAGAGTRLLVTHAGVIKAALATGDDAAGWPSALPFGHHVTR